MIDQGVIAGMLYSGQKIHRAQTAEIVQVFGKDNGLSGAQVTNIGTAFRGLDSSIIRLRERHRKHLGSNFRGYQNAE